MHAYLEGDVVVLGVDLRLLRGHALGVLGLQEMDADAVVEQPAVRRSHRPNIMLARSTSGAKLGTMHRRAADRARKGNGGCVQHAVCRMKRSIDPGKL